MLWKDSWNSTHMYLISKIKREQIPIDLLSGTGSGSLLGGSTSGQSGQGSLGSHSSHDVNYINNIYQNTNQTHLYVRSLFYKTRQIVNSSDSNLFFLVLRVWSNFSLSVCQNFLQRHGSYTSRAPFWAFVYPSIYYYRVNSFRTRTLTAHRGTPWAPTTPPTCPPLPRPPGRLDPHPTSRSAGPSWTSPFSTFLCPPWPNR